MNNTCFTVCGLLPIDGKILLVRHTYGVAKDRILLPGGYVQEGELPTAAVEREIFEETGVCAHADSLLAMQFKDDQWCAVFLMEYIEGKPRSDGFENSEVLLLSPENAINHSDITNMSRAILKAYLKDGGEGLMMSDYIPVSSDAAHYVLFQNGGYEYDAKATCEAAVEAVADKLIKAGFSKSGNLLYRYRDGKTGAEVIQVQRSQFNWANDCSFTLNAGLVKAFDFHVKRLTVALLKKAILFERSGSICYGRDEWYRFSLEDRKDNVYIQRVILPDVDKVLSYLQEKI
jgi:ADP-ribose pyrophosphatase YjhB (NUDIX family)